MIGDLLQALDRVEPKNPVLYHEFAKVFCRVVSVFVILHKDIYHIFRESYISIMLSLYLCATSVILWSTQFIFKVHIHKLMPPFIIISTYLLII